MFNSSFIKMTLLFFSIGSIGYAAGYNYALLSISTQENSAEQLAKTVTRYETLLNNAQNVIANTRKQQDDFLHTLKETLQKNSPPLNSAELSKNKNNSPLAESTQTNGKENQCGELIAKIDVETLKSVLNDTQSPDFNLRRRSLVALALLGSVSTRQEIDAVIANENEDPALRLELVKATDWQGLSTDLIQLIDSAKSTDIKVAAIQSAQDSRFSDQERRLVTEQLAQKFLNEPDDFVKINILDYFANTANNELSDIIESVPKEQITPSVKEHIEFLTNPSSEGSG